MAIAICWASIRCFSVTAPCDIYVFASEMASSERKTYSIASDGKSANECLTSSGASSSSRSVRSETTAIYIPEQNSSKSVLDHVENSLSRRPPITDVAIYIFGIIYLNIA